MYCRHVRIFLMFTLPSWFPSTCLPCGGITPLVEERNDKEQTRLGAAETGHAHHGHHGGVIVVRSVHFLAILSTAVRRDLGVLSGSGMRRLCAGIP